MIASILSRFLCLLAELLVILPLEYFLGGRRKNKEVASDDSTRSMASNYDGDSSDSEEDDSGLEDDDIACSDFIVEDIQRALKSRNRTLTMTDFVDRSFGAKDALALVDILQNQQRWRSVHFEDSVQGHTYRRWAFKKQNAYRHILQHLKDKLLVTFDTTVVIDTHIMSCKAILSLLKEVEKDPDVKSIVVRGKLKNEEAEQVTMGLVALLSSRGGWHSVQFDVQVASTQSSPREAQLVRKVCQRALQKVANERYIALKAY